jgi:hypothetical protein
LQKVLDQLHHLGMDGDADNIIKQFIESFGTVTVASHVADQQISSGMVVRQFGDIVGLDKVIAKTKFGDNVDFKPGELTSADWDANKQYLCICLVASLQACLARLSSQSQFMLNVQLLVWSGSNIKDVGLTNTLDVTTPFLARTASTNGKKGAETGRRGGEAKQPQTLALNPSASTRLVIGHGSVDKTSETLTREAQGRRAQEGGGGGGGGGGGSKEEGGRGETLLKQPYDATTLPNQAKLTTVVRHTLANPVLKAKEWQVEPM